MVKSVLIFVLLAYGFIVDSQKPQIFTKEDLKPLIVKGSSMFVCGGCRATVEILDNSYQKFDVLFPNADPNFCNPDLSSGRKWKNGDPNQGEAFWGSSNVFVWTTDLKHLMQVPEHGFMTLGAVYPLGKSEIKFREYPWRWLARYTIEGIILWGAHDLGFEFVHGVIF